MKNVFVVIISIILVLLVGFTVLIFAFDKRVQTSWFSGQIAAVKQSEIIKDEKLPKKAGYFYEEITYTIEDGKTTLTYSNKMRGKYRDKSTENSECYEITSIKYNEEGKKSEEYITKYYEENGTYYKEEKGVKEERTDLSEASLFFIFFMGFYGNDGKLKEEIINMIDNNLEYVSQIGTTITLHLVDGNSRVNITYDLLKSKVTKLESFEDTYSEEVLTHRVHYYVTL